MSLAEDFSAANQRLNKQIEAWLTQYLDSNVEHKRHRLYIAMGVPCPCMRDFYWVTESMNTYLLCKTMSDGTQLVIVELSISNKDKSHFIGEGLVWLAKRRLI